ncbi:MAG: 2-oxo acid dehydrogenase subunit E2 [Chloroflexi bacterium]|nr:MAG: 2-oxo acid dehydrogenase subunit E2 [Chloroflexota bacterium]
MPTPVKMPRLGESVAEGTIGSWLKNEGDWVEKDESLAEIITDKINAELPSPIAGRLTKILVKVDETVPVGADIAMIEENADVSASPPAQAAPGPDAAPVKNPEQAATPVIEQSDTSASDGAGEAQATTASQRRDEEERQRISPLARRLAREHDIDLNQIAGTGAGGRVRKEDILAYVEQRRAAPAAVSAASSYATTVVEVDMTNIARWLEKNKEDFKRREGYSISFVPFVMKAVCEGIRKFPMINSSWTEDNKIIIKKRINLGMAVATDEGLVVPTLYDTDQYTIAGLAKQISAIAQRARTNKLTLQDMQNSTFVVNNPGTFGTIISVPIINQPHAGILSMDAVVKRPVVIEDDAIAVRSMMYLCLSFDHRILDGAGAGGFLQAVRTKLQSYGREIDVY